MNKNILKNQRGMSLVEVTVAAAISVMVAMGVMQINENANKSMRGIKQRTEIQTFRTVLMRRLSSGDKCALATVQGGTSIIGLDITGDQNLGEFSSGNASGNEFTVGQPIPTVQGWSVTSAVIKAFASSTGSRVGSCDLEINLQRIVEGSAFGGRDSRMVIPMSCHVDASDRIEKCSSVVSADEIDGHWDVNTNGNGDYIEFPGIDGNAMVRIGTGSEVPGANIDAALTIDPAISGQDTPGGRTFGVHMVDNAAIAFGSNAASEIYSTNGSTISVDGVMNFTSSTSGNRAIVDLQMMESITVATNAIDNVSGTNIRVGDAGETVQMPNVSTSGTLGVGSNTSINGTLGVSGAVNVSNNVTANNYFYNSDRRIKKNIEKIENASDILSQLRGVTYFLRSDEYPDMNLSTDLQYGLIAQEVERVLPTLVEENPKTGIKSVEYANIVSVLIEGFKEEKAKRVKLEADLALEKKKNEDMKRTLELINKRLEKLEQHK